MSYARRKAATRRRTNQAQGEVFATLLPAAGGTVDGISVRLSRVASSIVDDRGVGQRSQLRAFVDPATLPAGTTISPFDFLQIGGVPYAVHAVDEQQHVLTLET